MHAFLFGLLCFYALILVSDPSHASAWLLPPATAQVILKHKTVRDDSNRGVPRFALRELYYEWGIHEKLMFSFKHRSSASQQNTSDPSLNEIELNTTTPVNLYLFPPRIESLIGAISGQPVHRERLSAMGIGYTHYGSPANTRSLSSINFALADKIQIQNTSLIAHLTLRKFFPAHEKRSDYRALILLEVGKYSAGTEYGGIYIGRQAIEESTHFIELPLGNWPIRLRLSTGRKYYHAERYREQLSEISVRFRLNAPTDTPLTY